jgi:formylglycine-generating enzyme required for sulfatase activity
MAGMVRIGAGELRPLFPQNGRTVVHVGPFAIDTVPVTQAELFAFIETAPEWRRDRIPYTLADDDYLKDWRSPRQPDDPAAPARYVSWHAAKAYCESRGRRLPSTAEWEYVARASETDPDAAATAAFRQRALELATGTPSLAFRNVWGVRAMHGGLAEWVEDFAPPPDADGGHAGHDHAPAAHCAAGATATGDHSDYAAFLRYAMRAALQREMTAANVGFRCAADIPHPRGR